MSLIAVRSAKIAVGTAVVLVAAALPAPAAPTFLTPPETLSTSGPGLERRLPAGRRRRPG